MVLYKLFSEIFMTEMSPMRYIQRPHEELGQIVNKTDIILLVNKAMYVVFWSGTISLRRGSFCCRFSVANVDQFCASWCEIRVMLIRLSAINCGPFSNYVACMCEFIMCVVLY